MKTGYLLLTGVFMCALLATAALGNATSNDPVLLPVKNDPTVSFRIWIKAGSQNDPQGKEGLAALTAALIAEGATTKNTYEQILDKLFPLASRYSTSVNVEMTVLYGRTHKDNVGEFYPLLTDALLRPAFNESDLERIRSRMLNYIETTLRYSSDEELGKAVLYTAVYAGTPYGHITEGTVQGLKSITLDDVKKFYATYYTRDNVVLGLGGGYDDTLLENLKKDVATLPAGIPTPVPAPEPKLEPGFTVTIVDKDAPATAISMGYPLDVLRGQKDWYALAIANSWLGEHRNSSSHLYQVIREARGLNYGDYSYIEHFPRGGSMQMPPQNVARRKQLFEIWIRPVPLETGFFSLRAALREYTMLVEKGMTKDQFELTRKFLKNYVLHYAATTMERLGYAIDDRFYAIEGSHLKIFREMMDKLTLADVNNAIKKHWQYGTMQIAIVTKDAQMLKEALVADAPSPITYATPKPETVLNEDKEIIVFPVKVSAENVKVVSVKELFEK